MFYLSNGCAQDSNVEEELKLEIYNLINSIRNHFLRITGGHDSWMRVSSIEKAIERGATPEKIERYYNLLCSVLGCFITSSVVFKRLPEAHTLTSQQQCGLILSFVLNGITVLPNTDFNDLSNTLFHLADRHKEISLMYE